MQYLRSGQAQSKRVLVFQPFLHMRHSQQFLSRQAIELWLPGALLHILRVYDTKMGKGLSYLSNSYTKKNKKRDNSTIENSSIPELLELGKVGLVSTLDA